MFLFLLFPSLLGKGQGWGFFFPSFGGAGGGFSISAYFVLPLQEPPGLFRTAGR